MADPVGEPIIERRGWVYKVSRSGKINRRYAFLCRTPPGYGETESDEQFDIGGHAPIHKSISRRGSRAMRRAGAELDASLLYGKSAKEGAQTSVIRVADVMTFSSATEVKIRPTWATDKHSLILATKKREFVMFAESVSQAAEWRVWIASELIKVAESGEARMNEALDTLAKAVVSEAGRTALYRALFKSPQLREKLTGLGEAANNVTGLLSALETAKRNAIESVGYGADELGGAWLDGRIPESQIDAEALSETMWDHIDKTAAKTSAALPASKSRTGWVEIRVFVSSTFADMHNEREILVRHVFPKLNAWGESRRIRFLYCDLRWGVPPDMSADMALKICLQELDECARIHTHAYCIGILSERYGWVPPAAQVSESTIRMFSWVPFASITHMEILHGIYRSKNPNAVVLIRDSGFVTAIPEEYKKSYVTTDTWGSIALSGLKSKLREGMNDQCVNYTCSVVGTQEMGGADLLKIDGLAAFGDACYTHMVNAARAQYGDQFLRPLKVSDVFQAAQDELRDAMGASCFGQTAVLEKLNEFLMSKTPSNVLMLVGPERIGKSTVLARAARNLVRSENIEALYHHMESGFDELLDRIIETFSHYTENDQKIANANSSEKLSLEERAAKLINEFSSTSAKKNVFLIDAQGINSRYAADRIAEMASKCPESRWIVTKQIKANTDTAEEEESLKMLRVGELDFAAREEMVRSRLAEYKKQMDPTQMEALLEKKSSGHPEWLELACDELRLHGVYHTINRKIKGLGETLQELLVQILDRIAEDESHDLGLTGRALGLISASTHGISESELRKLLAKQDSNSDDELPYAMWIYTVHKIKPLLVTFLDSKREKMYQLRWGYQFSGQVYDKFFQSRPSTAGSKAFNLFYELFGFMSTLDDIDRKMQELPGIIKATNSMELFTKYRSNTELWAKTPDFHRRELVRQFGCRAFVSSFSVSPRHQPEGPLMCRMCSFSRKKYDCYTCGRWNPDSMFPSKPGKEQDVVKWCPRHNMSKNKNNCVYCGRFCGFDGEPVRNCQICRISLLKDICYYC